jgi:hypothetical protein
MLWVVCLSNISFSPFLFPPTLATIITMTLPSTYKHALFKEAGGPLIVEDTPMTTPGVGEVLVKVEACGVWCIPIYPLLLVMVWADPA